MSDAPPDELDELDELGRALGQREREREAAELDARAPQWEAVVRGELELDEALERRRAAGDADDDLDLAAAYFQPFDASETSELVDGLLAGLQEDEESEPAAEAEAEAEAEVVPFVRPPAEPERAKAHDPGRSWIVPGGLLVAAAAAIVAWWVWPPSADIRSGTGGEGGTKIAAREPLPAYVLETDGGLKHLRGDTEGAPAPEPRHRYRRDTSFEWVLRPKVDVREAVGVRGFAFVDGGRAGLPLALEPLTQIAESGAIRITGKIAQLDLEPGRYTIAVAVGRPEDLPTQAEALTAPDDEAAWATRRIDIVIEDEGGSAPP